MDSRLETKILDAEIQVAMEAGRTADKIEPRVKSARYDPDVDMLVLELRSEVSASIPRHLLQGLTHALPDDLKDITILGGGQAIYFEALDTGFAVPELLLGVFGTKNWMAQKGGSVRSEAKAAAARSNGLKGGRPRKSAEASGTQGIPAGGVP